MAKKVSKNLKKKLTQEELEELALHDSIKHIVIQTNTDESLVNLSQVTHFAQSLAVATDATNGALVTASSFSATTLVIGGVVIAGGIAAASGGGGSSKTTVQAPTTTPQTTSNPTTTDSQTSTQSTSSTVSAITTTDVPSSTNDIINTLLYGIKYGGTQGTGVTLTYSFPWTTNTTAIWNDNYGTGENTATIHYGLIVGEIEAAKLALQSWGDVANVNFIEVSESNTTIGDIRFAFSSTVADAGAWGWSYLPSNSNEAGDVWISTSLDAYNSDFSTTGNGYASLIHELGHALGLKHLGDVGDGDIGPFIDAEHDNKLYSVMSYNTPENNLWYDTTTSQWCYVVGQTPMIYDILAIQYIYGVNNSYNNGDNIYTFDNIAPFRETIWDTGGVDTISVANSNRGSLIDLNEGSLSSIQTTRFYSENGISSTIDGSYNLGIAYGAIIENATGGSGDDKLIGNQYNNTLVGGSGADIFVFNSMLNSDSNKDTIIDFNHTSDTISLDDAVFTKLATGALASDIFKVGSATDSNDYILYDQTTGNLSYDNDGNGNGLAIIFANLANKPIDVAYNDFIII